MNNQVINANLVLTKSGKYKVMDAVTVKGVNQYTKKAVFLNGRDVARLVNKRGLVIK
jgi:hypothetical protein